MADSFDKFEFQLRIGNLGIKSKTGISTIPIEIVRYFDVEENGEKKEYNISIAWWNRDNEGYKLNFIGNRPFDYEVDSMLFFKIARLGQSLLDQMFLLEHYRHDA